MNNKEEIKKSTFWLMLPGILAGIAAVITSIAVLILALRTSGGDQACLPEQESEAQSQTLSILRQEISFRLQDIRTFLYQEPLTAGPLGHATSRLTAQSVGISETYQDTELRTLLFELEQVSPDEEKLIIQKIRGLFDEFSGFGPQAPYSEIDPVDPQVIQAARETFEEIESEWQSLVSHYE